MGFNTSVIVLNDALEQIKNDPAFGRNVARAIGALNCPVGVEGRRMYGVDVSSFNHANAATVIETHHADYESVIAFGGNRGIVLSECVWSSLGHASEPEELRILRQLADQLGYQIRKKPKRK